MVGAYHRECSILLSQVRQKVWLALQARERRGGAELCMRLQRLMMTDFW